MPISTSILEDAGLLRKGHFILPDGRHSGTYLDFMQAVEHPNVMMPYIEELARLVASIDYTHVSGVSPGGDIVASQVAIQIGGSIYGLVHSQGDSFLVPGIQLEGKFILFADFVSDTRQFDAAKKSIEGRGGTVVGLGCTFSLGANPREFPAQFICPCVLDANVFPPQRVSKWLNEIEIENVDEWPSTDSWLN